LTITYAHNQLLGKVFFSVLYFHMFSTYIFIKLHKTMNKSVVSHILNVCLVKMYAQL